MSVPPQFETVSVEVGKKKKTRKERLMEQREFEKSLGLNKGVGGLKYDKVADRHLDDDRFERELAFKQKQSEGAAVAAAAAGNSGQSSATFDAFMRMASGKEQRTIADRISDSNRPTWDDYKKKNEDALDMEGSQLKKMAEYRKNLDAEREAKLRVLEEKKSNKRKGDAAISSSSSDDEDDDSDSDDDRSSKKKKHRSSKKKKHRSKKHSKKHKKKSHSSSSSDDGDDDDDDENNDSDEHKKHKKHKKKSKKKKSKKKKEKKDGPGEENDKGFRYSDFFNKNSDDDSDSD